MEDNDTFVVSDFIKIVESYKAFKESIEEMPEHIQKEFKPILEAIYNRINLSINFLNF